TLERFKRQGDWFAKQHRKFQAEVLRTFSRCAGFVTNSIRDVPICRLGFMDDLDRWRFSPEETRPWLSDTTLLLRTPGHLRAFGAGERVACELGISNFAEDDFDGRVTFRIGDGEEQSARLAARRGELSWRGVEVAIPAAETAAAVRVE